MPQKLTTTACFIQEESWIFETISKTISETISKTCELFLSSLSIKTAHMFSKLFTT